MTHKEPAATEYLAVELVLDGSTVAKLGKRTGTMTYFPHFRIGPDGEYLGVAFIDGPEWIEPATKVEEIVALIYAETGVDYSALQPGASFDVVEGKHAIGRGRVLRRWAEPGDWKSRSPV